MVARAPQVGDVYAVPMGDERFGLTQVVATYGRDAYYFAVFGFPTSSEALSEPFDEVLTAPVLFLALSPDAKVHAGHWTFLGNAPVRGDVPLPAYKESVGTADHVDVVDYSGTRRRRASRQEVELLANRKVVAPVRLERALRASLGLEPWVEVYDELRPHGVTSHEVFG